MNRVDFALANLNGKILDVGYSVGGIHSKLFDFKELKTKLKAYGFSVEDFFCQPYSNENCYGDKKKWTFLFRKLIHYLLPKSLQEQMIIKAVKQ